MSARAPKTWASLMNVGPSSASVRVSRSARRRWCASSRARGPPNRMKRRRSRRNATTNGSRRMKTTKARMRRSEQDPPREAEEEQEAADVGERGDEDRRGHRRIDSPPLEQDRNERAGES